VKGEAMLTKNCRWCHETKPLELFDKHKQMSDGHLNRCKTCRQKWQSEYRKTPSGIEKRKKEKQYPENKKRYKQSEKGKEAAKKYKPDPVRQSAKNAVKYSLKKGHLLRQPCFVCGEKGLAHHSSYAKDMQLLVTWLCVHHHNQLHNEHKGYKSWI
jgi:hypothetical protein